MAEFEPTLFSKFKAISVCMIIKYSSWSFGAIWIDVTQVLNDSFQVSSEYMQTEIALSQFFQSRQPKYVRIDTLTLKIKKILIKL